MSYKFKVEEGEKYAKGCVKPENVLHKDRAKTNKKKTSSIYETRAAGFAKLNFND